MKFKNFLLQLKNPKKWVAIVFSIFALLVISATITLVVLGFTDEVFIYILYGLSALCLTYLVYLAIYYYKAVKQSIINIMQKFSFTRNLLNDYGYRSVIFAGCSFVINVAYAISQVVFAILARSIWLGALGAYYVMISAIRGGLVIRAVKSKNNLDAEKKQITAFRDCGICLLVLNTALVGAVIQVVQQHQSFAYAGIMVYVMATYTFYKLAISIYNLFKAKRQEDFIVKAIKNLSFADAMVSIFALQTALLMAFAEGANVTIPNALTGGLISVLVIALGIFMIIRGQIKLKHIKKEKNNE